MAVVGLLKEETMRRYEDPVEVRREGGAGAPEQFLWQGRLWKVRAVVARWVETGAWWHSSSVRAVTGDAMGPEGTQGDQQRDWEQFQEDLLTEREFWRVEAGRPGPGRATGPSSGVFDLSYDTADGRWQLVGCLD